MKPIKINLTIQPENLIKTGLFLIIAILIFTAGFYFGRLHYEKTELTTLEQCKPTAKDDGTVLAIDYQGLKNILVSKNGYDYLCLLLRTSKDIDF